MSSKSPSQIKVGDRVHCFGSDQQLDAACIDVARVGTRRGEVIGMGTGRGFAEVRFDGAAEWFVPLDLLVKLDTPETDAGEVEEAVIDQIRSRRDAGRAKYGTTMERTDLSILQWVQHAQEEAMDFSIYLEKLKRVLKEKGLE